MTGLATWMLAVAVSNGHSLAMTIPVPADASAVTRIANRAGSLPGVKFTMDARYPEAPSVEFYRRFFDERGWCPCTSPFADKWSEFMNSTKSPPRWSAWRDEFWLNKRTGVLAWLKVEAYPATKRSPASDTQKIMIAFYDTPQLMEEAMRSGSVVCGEAKIEEVAKAIAARDG